MTESLAEQNHETLIAQLRPEYESIVWLVGGDNRDIAVVDGKEAFRFSKDADGADVNRYEFEALRLLQNRLSVQVPRPIELADDGSYNVLSFLPGKVLAKHEVVALPLDARRDLGTAIATVINQLNNTVSRDELSAIPTKRSLVRFQNGYFESIYKQTLDATGGYTALYREQFKRLEQLRPAGPESNVIVFGDFTSPNMVLSDENQLIGLIDWTELGFGDIHNELRPVFSVLGQEAFNATVAVLNPSFGPINQDLVRQCAIVHELSILVSGKQKGILSPEREKLAMDSVNQWLGKS